MLRNLLIVSLLNIGRLLLQSLIAIVIALFTTPARYGLIGFSLPLMGFLILVGSAGLAPAIIRQRELTGDELGAAFTLSCSIATLLATALAVVAPMLESRARLPGLAPVLIALGLAVIPGIAAETLRAAIERDLRYRALARIELAALALAVAATLGAAVAGAEIWSLVVYHLVLQSTRAAALLGAERGRLRLNLGWAAVRPTIFFGGLSLLANACNFAARNADNVLLGASLGARAVGVYGIAYQLMTLPLIAISWPASNLLLATLKRIAPGDHLAFVRTVRDMLAFTAAVALPLAAWLAAAFPWAARRVFPPRWAEVAPILAVLAPAGAIQALAAFTGAVLLARDRPDLNLAVSAAAAIVLICGFVVGVRFGLGGFVLIYALLSSAVSLAQLAFALRVARLAFARTLAPLVPAGLSAALVAVVFVALARAGGGWAGWLAANLVSTIAVGAVYAVAYPRLLGRIAKMARFGREPTSGAR